MNAPTNSPAKYFGVSDQGMPLLKATPTVTAGLRCAPEKRATEYAPTITPIAQPKGMTIQPLFWAFDLASSTAATTPSPRRISSAVPITSALKISNAVPSLLAWTSRAGGSGVGSRTAAELQKGPE